MIKVPGLIDAKVMVLYHNYDFEEKKMKFGYKILDEITDPNQK